MNLEIVVAEMVSELWTAKMEFQVAAMVEFISGICCCTTRRSNRHVSRRDVHVMLSAHLFQCLTIMHTKLSVYSNNCSLEHVNNVCIHSARCGYARLVKVRLTFLYWLIMGESR